MLDSFCRKCFTPLKRTRESHKITRRHPWSVLIEPMGKNFQSRLVFWGKRIIFCLYYCCYFYRTEELRWRDVTPSAPWLQVVGQGGIWAARESLGHFQKWGKKGEDANKAGRGDPGFCLTLCFLPGAQRWVSHLHSPSSVSPWEQLSSQHIPQPKTEPWCRI